MLKHKDLQSDTKTQKTYNLILKKKLIPEHKNIQSDTKTKRPDYNDIKTQTTYNLIPKQKIYTI